MKRILAMLTALMLLCGGALAECPKLSTEEYPRVDGSTATLPLSYALMEAACGVTGEQAKEAIRHSKTTESFYELIYGNADLLLVYAPSEDAFQAAKDAGVELETAEIGMDALVFLVNEGNPVQSLTHEQLVDIYTGRITNWREVGGEDRAIVAYQRVENSGSQVMMEKQCMQGVEMMDAPVERRPSEMGELVDEIASYRNTADAIGYSVYYYIKNMYMQEGVKLLSVNGVAPANETIAAGEYPFTQPFYAVIRADAAEDSPARQLYSWLTTDEGRALIEQAGYVAKLPEAGE